MRSPSALGWLLRKESCELLAARSWWVLVLAIGPLVGLSFISAVRTYAELSGVNGVGGGGGEAFSPLVGIWAPTFSACELAAVFLLPFVAIRLVAEDRFSGALKIELQRPLRASLRIAAKVLVLLGGWAVATAAPLVAVILWRAYGGAIHWPELAAVVIGHLLNAGITIAFAAAVAAITDHPATAAIVTLAVTVATWVLSFAAAVYGGMWVNLARVTPAAMVAEFQHGLVRADMTAAALALIAFGLSVAAIWMRLGVPIRRRVWESLGATFGLLLCLAMAPVLRGSVDLSENRLNSFPRSDERALASIRQPLRLTAHLAPDDPRRSDLERNAVAKLHRVMQDFSITYVSTSSTGLFEQSNEGYGEIQYDLGGTHAVSRATTAEGVLEVIYELAHVTPGDEADEVFRGHPLAAEPRGAAAVFYIGWPLAVGAAFMIRRTPR